MITTYNEYTCDRCGTKSKEGDSFVTVSRSRVDTVVRTQASTFFPYTDGIQLGQDSGYAKHHLCNECHVSLQDFLAGKTDYE